MSYPLFILRKIIECTYKEFCHFVPRQLLRVNCEAQVRVFVFYTRLNQLLSIPLVVAAARTTKATLALTIHGTLNLCR